MKSVLGIFRTWVSRSTSFEEGESFNYYPGNGNSPNNLYASPQQVLEKKPVQRNEKRIIIGGSFASGITTLFKHFALFYYDNELNEKIHTMLNEELELINEEVARSLFKLSYLVDELGMRNTDLVC